MGRHCLRRKPRWQGLGLFDIDGRCKCEIYLYGRSSIILLEVVKMWEVNGWFWLCLAMVFFGLVQQWAFAKMRHAWADAVQSLTDGMEYWEIVFSEVNGISSNHDKKRLVEALRVMRSDAACLVDDLTNGKEIGNGKDS